MELISLQFALFLALALCLYYTVGRLAPRFQWVTLLVSSLGFMYVAGGRRALLFLILVALITWGFARHLGKLSEEGKQARKEAKGRDAKRAVKAAYLKRRRIGLVLGLVLTFSILAYFKYFNVVLSYVGLADSPTSLGIVLPLGLSFYLFQSVGYLIDAYNEKVTPQASFLRYLTFVSWFPALIQGPINRYRDMEERLLTPHAPDGLTMHRGLVRLAYGVLKKVAIANVLANVVSVVFEGSAGPAIPGSLALWGVLVYSIQMYADFSGGIEIVEGASELFGIEMAPNFRQPYFSASLAEFWRRWHMSLGAWIRDYVFYPLAVTKAFKRFGKWAQGRFGRHAGRTLPACAANIIVFLIVGLWHGAEAHYIVWGLYNGVVVALSDYLAPAFDRLAERLHVKRESNAFHAFAVVRTFLVVLVGRFFDCFAHVSDAFAAMANIATGAHAQPLADALTAAGATYASMLGFTVPTIVACLVVLAVDVASERGADVREGVVTLPLVGRAALAAALVTLIAAAAAFDTTSGGGGFLYANF